MGAKKRASVADWFKSLPSRAWQRLRRIVRPTAADKKRRRRRWKHIGQLILTVFLIGVISACLVCGVLVVYVVSTFDADRYIPELGQLSAEARTVIYVKNDQDEFEPYQNLLGGNMVWTDLADIPVNLQNAVIAIEDEHFAEHDGVDWWRTTSAFVNLFLNRVFHLGSTEYGGSTLTQQLIKVTSDNRDHSIKRKITEILAATELEKSEYTKQQVLEGYLNYMPLTGELVGVGIGARNYFGKEVQDLDLAECAVLATITNNPGTYDPYKHPENVRQRQRLVLAKMYELEFITKDEYLQAVNEELVFKSTVAHQNVQDYYVDLVVEDVIADLMEEYGWSYNYAEYQVYYGGLSIYSAEKPDLQHAVEAIYTDEKNFPSHRDSDKEDPQAAFFAVDYEGRVIATIGGRGVKDANRVFNRSTQALRSPGSSIKPLTSYGPSVALDLAHYSSMVRDAPIVLRDGKKWPHNYEAKSTPDRGDVLLGVALQKSLNTVAARLVQQLTPQRSYDYATNTFHLTTLVVDKAYNGRVMTDIDLSPLALGAFTEGVTNREMAAAYAVYGSGGYYYKPYTYYKVVRGKDEEESTLLTGGKKPVMVLDPQTCYVMLRLLNRVTTYGTAADVHNKWSGWFTFGKTGTSESEKDVYFAGGTPLYMATSWFGYDDNTLLSKKQTGYAKSLWNLSMKALHKNEQIREFVKPSGIVEAKYCTATGQLATDACPDTDTGYYKASNVPGYCEKHAGNPLTNGSTGTTVAGGTTAATTATTATSATESTTTEATTGTTATGTTAATEPTPAAEEPAE